MKIKRLVLGMAIVAVAGVNVYKANDVMEQQNGLSLLTLENIAEAQEQDPGDNSGQQRNGRNLRTTEDKTGNTVYCCGKSDNPHNNCTGAKFCEDV